MRRLRSLALPTSSGVLYFVSWIGFGVWPLAFVCFVPLLFSLREATPREALRRGAWFGFIALACDGIVASHAAADAKPNIVVMLSIARPIIS